MHRLARYSLQRLRQLQHQLRLDMELAQGYLVLLRGHRDLAAQGDRLVTAPAVR
mgnify:CR=1 FL=1